MLTILIDKIMEMLSSDLIVKVKNWQFFLIDHENNLLSSNHKLLNCFSIFPLFS